MSRLRISLSSARSRQWAWFAVLWICGVVGTALLVLPFRILVAAALNT